MSELVVITNLSTTFCTTILIICTPPQLQYIPLSCKILGEVNAHKYLNACSLLQQSHIIFNDFRIYTYVYSVKNAYRHCKPQYSQSF